MLKVNEFLCGSIGLAKPISLLRTLTPKPEEFLIVGPSDTPVAIMLEGGNAFDHFPSSHNDYWTGLIVVGLSVEVDETSIFDARFQRSPFGALVRMDTDLAICAKARGHRVFEYIPVVQELPSVGEALVGFYRWQVVLGDGTSKRCIKSMDVSRDTQK